ncbi:MAG TPA: ATP-dependent metallopeptidase FtsH/Yme1/Tma family protein, partial [Rhizomicrobium sp.]|nr:ATP-dependent metallopeptidase FtsH/Yme1/Tma family protein [Rhizomicrobium sp.]
MNNLRNLALWIVIALLLVFLFNMFQSNSTRSPASAYSYSKFTEMVVENQMREVTFQGDAVKGTLTNNTPFTTTVPNNDTTLWPTLKAHNVDTKVSPADDGMPSLLAIFINWFPMLLIFGVWVFFLRQMQSGGGKAMGFGKSRAKLLTERQGRVTFEDVAGVDEAKDDLKEIVDFLRDPQKFQRLGG